MLNADFHSWIFDMDGTLTVAVHDFGVFKAANGLPSDRPILEAVADESPERRAEVLAALDAWELGLARQARAAAGAAQLLAALGDRNLGILTRNTRANALVTLGAAGLAGFFRPEDVLGRDEAPPKPSPDGVLCLLQRWGVRPEGAVVVGDYVFDILAGQAAGTATIHVHSGGPPARADVVVGSLCELLAILG